MTASLSRILYGTAAALGLASAALADPTVTDNYNLFGVPGLIDMPSAEMAEDGELTGTVSLAGTSQRTTLTFQLAPRLTGSFRYAKIPEFDRVRSTGEPLDRFDRSFDIRFLLLEETEWLPAVAIGLQDFIGTGVYSGEYIVATKGIGDRLRVTGGLGWGRLGSANKISDGYGTRSGEFTQTGGTANLGDLFNGPIGVFGGLSWDVTDKLNFKAEYSSDNYTQEQDRDIFERESPWNFGIDYEFAEGAHLTASYLYGNELGVGLVLRLNPKQKPFGPGNETAPVAVFERPSRTTAPELYGTGWAADGGESFGLRDTIRATLENEGIELRALALNSDSAELRIENERYSAQSQAIGRTARALTRILPASVEQITIVPTVDGIPSSSVTLLRSDIERLENAPADAILDRAAIVSGARPLSDNLEFDPEAFPRFSWSITPYTELSLFDPDQPIRGDLGIQAAFELDLVPGVVLSGTVRKKALGNLDEIQRASNSVLPRVRSDFNRYLAEGDPRIENLTLAWFARPGTDLYSRVTVGLLERMYAGISTEVLWKPVDSRLAIGGELNYVQQRDFDGGFALRDYDVVTGHVSAYYDFENGYHAQVDVGRYLAGDYGATFAVDREFRNGWRVGAFATFTDVPFEDFGEGSFDKGIRLTIPFDQFTGKPTRTVYNTTLKPLTRDGGARLRVADRLYGRVRDAHTPALEERSGRFWK